MSASLMDLIGEKLTELRDPNSEFSTLAAGELVKEPEVVTRMRKMFDFIVSDIKGRSSKKMQFFMAKIIEEALDDVSEAPPDILEAHLLRSASAMYWVATGRVIENMPVPDGFWDSVGFEPQPIENSPAPKALESGASGE